MARQDEHERTLSAAEQRRLDAFEQLSASLQEAGYSSTFLTTGVVKANVFAILFAVPFIAVFGALFFAVNGPRGASGFSFGLDLGPWGFLAFMVILVVLIVVHELIHGLTWATFSTNHFADIEFGFIKEHLTPYCTCKAPLAKWSYIAGAAMPCIVLGILPSIAGVATGSFECLAMGLLMTMAAGGDALVVWQILKHRTTSADVLYIDHPTQIGFVVFERPQAKSV